ncbi:VOC family protein [Halobacillus locisalis]|uniref:VOC family protein n=1 Tax=Halobacillus locisalis TaxID=220753 RepID=A0A838CRG7_9BACI|nr:VOC family protein [Halobacillus locisalis]MBA2174216.1 VOC family protein [Halobacillus locisalis]
MTYQFEAIDHIQLAAPKGSEEEARAFFTGVLGLEEIEKPALLRKRGGVWFRFGHYQIHIGIEEPFTPAKKAHPAFRIKDLEALKGHLRDKEYAFIEDDNLPGANRIYVYDPFGNRMEMLEWQ